MGNLYGAAPVDEIKLGRMADDYLTELSGVFPSEKYLTEITRDHGADLATMIFYKSILQIPENQQFIAKIDSFSIKQTYPRTNIKLYVVPAFFYQEYPEVGGDGKHILEVAKVCGIDAELIPIKSTGTVSENTEIIYQTLNQCDADRVWIMSMSKGSAEVRLLFQNYDNQVVIDKVKIWFNVNGLANGCHLVDHMLKTPVRRLKTRALCTATGASYKGLEQLLTAQPEWQQKLVLPAALKVINICGVPLLSHVQKALIARYNRLKHLGPNDGMVLLSKAFIAKGPVYPLWGADHFLRDTRIAPLLYRLFGCLIDEANTNT